MSLPLHRFSPLLCLSGGLALLSSLSQANDDMLDLSLEQLMSLDVVVTSASKSDQKAIDATAAIHVITQEDIRRSGSTSIAEALRMAPGLHVAQISATEWAVASRGLNGRFSRYLLVLIDGRSIYSSLFSGVNWDEQNLILADIERIEVIRGPGGSLWGSNAVNGIINIITRTPTPEDGQQLTLRAGDTEKALIQGIHNGSYNDLKYRVSAQFSQQEGLSAEALNFTEDDWYHSRVSFAGQWQDDNNQLDINADIAKIAASTAWPRVSPSVPGYSLLAPKEHKDIFSLQARWMRRLNDKNRLELTASADSSDRESDVYHWKTENSAVDISWLQEREHSQLHLGLNYRWTLSRMNPAPTVGLTLSPEKDNIEITSAYGQYQHDITDQLQLTLGARAEEHSETGSNFQPTLRAMWTPAPSHRLWGALSKAVSIPSRAVFDRSRINILTLPFNALSADSQAQLTSQGLAGFPLSVNAQNTGFELKNTEISSIDLGYRYQYQDQLSVDVALFHHRYKHLLSTRNGTLTLEPTADFSVSPPILPTNLSQPFLYDDQGEATTEGMEISINWRATDNWHLQYSGSYLDFDSESTGEALPAEFDLGQLSISEDTPTVQHSLRSLYNINDKVSVDLWLYHYGEMKSSQVDAFTSANLRVEWRPTDQLSLAIVGKNLLDSGRSEFYREVFFTDRFKIERNYFLELQWNFD
jgi:iron complex outermembrane recepter protein